MPRPPPPPFGLRVGMGRPRGPESTPPAPPRCRGHHPPPVERLSPFPQPRLVDLPELLFGMFEGSPVLEIRGEKHKLDFVSDRCCCAEQPDSAFGIALLDRDAAKPFERDRESSAIPEFLASGHYVDCERRGSVKVTLRDCDAKEGHKAHRERGFAR